MLGKDIESIKHLKWWNDKEVDEYTLSLLTSFENFMYVCFMARFRTPPTRLQYDIGRYMESGPDKRGVMAFRNAAKTTIAACYCNWWIFKDPRLTIRVISSKDSFAKDITRECRIMYDEVEELEFLHPSLNKGSSALLDNAQAFNVFGAAGGKSSTFEATAISGNVTGGRAHIVLKDDIEVPKNCVTAPLREKLRGWDREVNNILHDSKSTNFIEGFVPFEMYLGTPHTEESIYTYKMTQGFKFRVWPARYPNKKYMETIGHLVSPMLLDDMKKNPKLSTGYGPNFDEGAITETERFGEEDFLEKRISQGAAGFAKQQMLDVSLQNIDKYPLKVSDLIITDLDNKKARASYMSEREPAYAISDLPNVGMPGDLFYRPSYMSDDVYKYETIIMAIDPSGRGPDETAYAIVATLHGNFFLLDAGGYAGHDEGYSEEVLKNLVAKAKVYGVNTVYIESNMGDGMFKNLITPFFRQSYPCHIEEDRATGQKELRIIETLEPILARRKLIVNRHIIQSDYDNVPKKAKDSDKPSYRMIYQLARITRDRGCLGHDDRLDAVELAVRKLAHTIAIDQDEQEKSKMIDDFMNGKRRKHFYSTVRGSGKSYKTMF